MKKGLVGRTSACFAPSCLGREEKLSLKILLGILRDLVPLLAQESERPGVMNLWRKLDERLSQHPVERKWQLWEILGMSLELW